MLNHPLHPSKGLIKNGNPVILSSEIPDQQPLRCWIINLKGSYPLAWIIACIHITRTSGTILMTLLFSFFRILQDKHSLLLPTSHSSSTAEKTDDAGHQHLYPLFPPMCRDSKRLRISKIREWTGRRLGATTMSGRGKSRLQDKDQADI